MNEDGTVHFTTTLFALIRESLSIKCGPDIAIEEMNKKDEELRWVITKLWPVQAKKRMLYLLVPDSEELKHPKLTVGKIYTSLLILENWRSYKSSVTQGDSNGRMMSDGSIYDEKQQPQTFLERIVGAVRGSYQSIDKLGISPQESGRTSRASFRQKMGNFFGSKRNSMTSQPPGHILQVLFCFHAH